MSRVPSAAQVPGWLLTLAVCSLPGQDSCCSQASSHATSHGGICAPGWHSFCLAGDLSPHPSIPMLTVTLVWNGRLWLGLLAQGGLNSSWIQERRVYSEEEEKHKPRNTLLEKCPECLLQGAGDNFINPGTSGSGLALLLTQVSNSRPRHGLLWTPNADGRT